MAKEKQAGAAPKKETLAATEPTLSQKNIVDFVKEKIRSASGESCLALVKAAPGSGKTTTIISCLKATIDEIDKANDEKVLLLAFNSKMKKEIEDKAKKAGFDMAKLEIKTIHSLFFRGVSASDGPLSNGSFSLDYTKGFFTRPMIRQVLSSLVVGKDDYDLLSSSELKKDRIFSEEILTDLNISILHKYINAYYSSPYDIKEFKKLDRIADFFSKNEKNPEVSLGRLEHLKISDADASALLDTRYSKLLEHGYTNQELFYLLCLQRVSTLAKIRIMDESDVSRQKTIQTPVEVLGPDGTVRKTYTHTYVIDDKKTQFHHIFRVPHNYYYKEFMRLSFSDPSFIKKVFGQYRAIFIDEAQDNDMIFFEILVEVLSSAACKLAVAVGDPHQAIYGFKSPDHFDILKYCSENSKKLENKNIKVVSLPLGETFRFGRDIANFVNLAFPESSVVGRDSDEESFVSKRALTPLALTDLVNELASRKNLKAGIVCRTNGEALDLYLKLMKSGCASVSIQSGIKGDLKKFIEDGISGIDDLKIRGDIAELCGQSASYADIIANDEARRILVSSGYGQFVKFSKEEIERYILPADRQRKNISITTAHASKGLEFDYVIVGGDFFAKELGRLEDGFEHEEDNAPDDEFTPSINSEVDESQNYGNVFNMILGQTTQLSAGRQDDSMADSEKPLLSSFDSLITNTSLAEEKNTLYVAITRAKKGVFFMDSPVFRSILPKIEESRAWLKEADSPLFETKESILAVASKEEDGVTLGSTNSLFSC